MFFNKDKEFKLLLEETAKSYKDLEEQYLKLRKEHLELQDKHEKFDIIEDSYKDTIDKLAKDLAYKTELLTLYHIKFGEECAAIIEKRCSKKYKNDDSEEVEL